MPETVSAAQAASRPPAGRYSDTGALRLQEDPPLKVDDEMAIEITAHTILPARRESIELKTADGFTLVGELALPENREPAATLVTFHPLPTAAGMMDSHVLRKAAWR